MRDFTGDYYLDSLNNVLGKLIVEYKECKSNRKFLMLYGLLEKHMKIIEKEVEEYRKKRNEIEENYEPVLDRDIFISLGYSGYDPVKEYLYNPILDEMVVKVNHEFGVYTYLGVEKDSSDRDLQIHRDREKGKRITPDTDPGEVDFSEFKEVEYDCLHCRKFVNPKTGQELIENYDPDSCVSFFKYYYREGPWKDWIALPRWTSSSGYSLGYSLIDGEDVDYLLDNER